MGRLWENWLAVGAIKTSAPRIVPGLTRYNVPLLPRAVRYIVPGLTGYNAGGARFDCPNC